MSRTEPVPSESPRIVGNPFELTIISTPPRLDATRHLELTIRNTKAAAAMSRHARQQTELREHLIISKSAAQRAEQPG